MLIQRNIFRILLAIALNTALLVGALHAQTIAGKVVGVADGDTITVLQNQTQYKIRLYGIDTPEKGQDFDQKLNSLYLKWYAGSIFMVFKKTSTDMAR